ncbi:heterokaryon incompatibility protein-domain-containing protein, partial [Bisporella sp. PMI_857]
MTIGYHPLDKNIREIRVLDLQQSPEKTSLLRCRIRHIPLGTAAYTALSYVWGDQTNNRVELEVEYETRDSSTGITKLETYPTTVGENLASALFNLRQKDAVLTLWIDAVCINQDDHLEKKHQLLLMAMIYLEASAVIAWLGEPTENMEIARHTFLEWPAKFIKTFVGIRELCASTYWTRVWTLQEFFL